MAEQSFTVPIPDDFDPSDRAEFIDAIIDHIIDRTTDGVGIRGNGRRYNFPAYTAEYIAEKGDSTVDLMLSGEMLDSLKVLRKSSDEVTIGYRDGSKVNAKAEGNQLGSYGKTPKRSKARRFLGLNKGELKDLAEFVRGGQDE